MAKTRIEETVEEIRSLEREHSEIESFVREMRLGRKVEAVPPPFTLRFKAMVFGHGWAKSEATEIPRSIQSEFQFFLEQRASLLVTRIEQLRNGLADLEKLSGS